MKSALLVFLSFLILGIFAWAIGNHFRPQLNPAIVNKKPNVLVLSFCSLRMEHLAAYNPKARPLPNLDRFLSQSLVFKNAVNGLPWTNITNFIDVPTMRNLGYKHAKRKSLRIPAIPIHKNTPQNEANQNLNFVRESVRNYELNYAEGFEQLYEMIMQSAAEPFFISTHIKYMHFPMIDSVNQKDHWQTEFSKGLSGRLSKYLENPARHPEKAPLFLTLFADPSMVRTNRHVAKFVKDPAQVRIGQIYQMLTDENLLADWRKSEGFAQDLEILQEAYYLKLKNLDRQLGEVFDLYGHEKLKEDTIIVLTGDHGESFMERGQFLHAHNVHENQILYPMAVHVPKLNLRAPEFVEEQYDMASHDRLINELIPGYASVESIRAGIRNLSSNVFLRNCSGTVSGLRSPKSLKLVVDLEGFKLFDVEQDPTESKDLKDEKPDDYFAMKAEYMRLSFQKRNLYACENGLDPFDGFKPQLRIKPEFDSI